MVVVFSGAGDSREVRDDKKARVFADRGRSGGCGGGWCLLSCQVGVGTGYREGGADFAWREYLDGERAGAAGGGYCDFSRKNSGGWQRFRCAGAGRADDEED